MVLKISEDFMAKPGKYGDWQVLSSHGEGGQAWTYLVRHKDGREGILKVIKNPKRGWRFDREVRALKYLKSATVPAFFEAGESEDRPWVVTENCGQPLMKLIDRAPLVQRLSWFRDLVLATRDAHQAEITHRDIKPDNVVISIDKSAAYLVDFGICAISDADPSFTSLEAFGNAAFAAPECALGNSERPGKPCDIYSLGKVLYWITSGGKPIFREQTDRLEGTFLPMSLNIERRILSVVYACVQEASRLRPTAEELFTRTQNLLVYAEEIIREEDQGLYRIIDNFGNNNEFNVNSCREVTSPGLVKEDLKGCVVVGSILANRAQSMRFENRTTNALQIYRILVGMSCLSPVARIFLSVVEDSKGPSFGRELWAYALDLAPGPAKIYSVECNIQIAPGRFWLSLRPSNPPKTYANIFVATQDVAPYRSIQAESDNGGETWKLRESSRGSGFAVRIDGKVN
jgi:serine/threonine protein kinase